MRRDLHTAAATGDLFQAGAVQDHLTKGQGQMVMLMEYYDFVIGGNPDRDTMDLAILEAGTGRVRDQTADRTDGPAYYACWPGRISMLRGAASGLWRASIASPQALSRCWLRPVGASWRSRTEAILESQYARSSPPSFSSAGPTWAPSAAKPHSPGWLV